MVLLATSLVLLPCLELLWVVCCLQVATGAEDEVLVTGGSDQCLKVWDCRSRSQEPIQSSRAFKVGAGGEVGQGVDAVHVLHPCAPGPQHDVAGGYNCALGVISMQSYSGNSHCEHYSRQTCADTLNLCMFHM
jgi:hypothetical protein